MGLSSSGIGSNLDVESIVSQLMSVERKPLTALATKEASFQAKLSGFGTLKGAIASFQNSMRSLTDANKFQGMRITAADASIASVSAATGSSPTPGTYTLEVTKLAQAQKLVAEGQTSATAAIGGNTTTTLSFDFGTISDGVLASGKYSGSSFLSSGAGIKTVTIDSSNNSLNGIRDAINSANVGVTATVVNDGGTSPYRLALTVNTTGKTNSLKISVAGDSTISGILSHDPGNTTGQALSETTKAQNAEFKVDGISISKTTNSASDVIAGVNLTLAKEGATTSVTVARDSSTLTSSVTAFVKAYNDIAQTLRDAAAYNSSTKTAAILNGEASVRAIQTQVRSMLNTPVAGDATAYSLLSQVGVTIQKDGLLTLDSAKLQKAVDTNFSGIAGLFATVGKVSDSLATYSAATAKTKPGSYAVTIDQIARQASATAVAPTHTPGKGSITASAVGGLTIDGTNDTLEVTLDGVSHTVTLDQQTYADADLLAAAVQTKINDAYLADGKSVNVTQTGGALKITSASSGTSSAVNITAGNGKTNLLGAAPTVVAGSVASIASGSDTLEVQLDGVTATVTLDAGNYSYASLAAAIQSKINGNTSVASAGASVTVTESGGVFTVRSNRYGASSSVGISGGTAKAALFGTPNVVLGLDVAGKINGFAATGSGQVLTGAEGNDAEGLAIKITGGAIGSRGTVSYSQGYANQFEKLAASLLNSEGPLQARTNGLDTSLKSLAKTKQRLTDQLAATEKRYRAQFSALDTMIASMSKTSSFLTQQLANLPKIE